ncbi:unnamed protein product [Gongylonema pulchrum]|uniref:Uncharacterized protein n=1 Tax=Gongylonema pulchrum TaxID=637853 RepID=A0A183ENF5_9BILA|nr:unnamed protein product [Gongylonema pulchrum]
MLLVPGLIREWTAEVLFEEYNDIRSLPQLILDAVFRVFHFCLVIITAVRKKI